jgi:putative intracellular protease/amidase
VSDQRVFVLVFDGFADWEPAHALAELRRRGHRQVTSVGFSAGSVVSMGGLRVVPDGTLSDVKPAKTALFLMPGGEMWERGEYPADELEPILRSLEGVGVPIAAICAATVALARAGLLRARRHTSNGRDYLARLAPGYDNQAGYVEEPAVRDRRVITAGGLHAVEFAREIFIELGVFNAGDLKTWFDLFKHGRAPASIE